ncbi:MlaD family protein [Arhodomonas sp. AD133]|uniref:MlaD family protein n=1 Tax=Arhodomonas sp. AD133 TaxID=3415009 RepID=UPI003EB830EE
MDNRVNYTLVGLFVVILTTALVGGGLWLASGLRNGDTSNYSIYLTDSVSGLSRDSAVTYRGVDVGRVNELEIDPQRPQRVHAVISVDSELPLRQGTTATLKMRGVTGIAYVELTGGKANAPLLRAQDSENYPVIPYEESLLRRLDTAVTEGMDTLDRLGRQVSDLLGKSNQRALSETLENMAKASGTLADNSDRIERVLARTEQLLERTDGAVSGLPETFADVRAAARRIERMAATYEEAGAELAALGKSGDEGMRQFSDNTLPRIDALAGELRTLSQRLGRLIDSIAERPSQLIYGRPRRAPGPGEEG